MSETVGSGFTRLLPITQLPNFVAIISPIIITFVLFLSGGSGLSIMPGVGWAVSLLIVTFIIESFKKVKKLERPREYKLKSLSAACGSLFTPILGSNHHEFMPAQRLVFHAFTATYLGIHIFGSANLSDEEKLIPGIFFGIILLLSLGDVARMKLIKCFNMTEIMFGILIGLAFGCIAFLTATIEDGMLVFFKKPESKWKCDNGLKKNERKLMKIV